MVAIPRAIRIVALMEPLRFIENVSVSSNVVSVSTGTTIGWIVSPGANRSWPDTDE